MVRQSIRLRIPDKTWPSMWRVRYDGNLSDMANLSRAKDAAVAIAERGPPARDRLRLRWKFEPIEEAIGGVYSDSIRKDRPEAA
jgi:hypothetical protein